MLTIDVKHKRFPDAAMRDVLRDIRIEIDSGQFVCVLGPSGCGKTTLLNILAGLDQDFDGTITYGNGAAGRSPTIGYVFQSPALLPWRTVGENLSLVMSPDQIARGLIAKTLAAVGLSDYRDAYPKSLSLGMSRRVALARAFVVEPDVLLMDEPFVSLDEATAQSLRGLLIELWAAKPTIVIFVTHDSREAVQMAQRIVVLSDGPASVVQDRAVVLSAANRSDPAAIENERQRILACPPQA